jgi:mannose-6-phosphate isomerase-like protein (cupin superfamily)
LINTQDKVYEVVLKVRKFIKEANITIPPGAELEISHHYGINKFYEYGMVMITVVNREYCKKLLILLPGQTHPEQYHLKKEETFFVVYGEVELYLDGKKKICKPGEVVTIERGIKHKMTTKTGCIIEEISTTHYKEDSYYTDETIMQNKKRKTIVSYWQEWD